MNAIFLAFMLLVATTPPAHAGFIIVPLLLGAAFAATTAGIIVSGLITFGLSIAASMLLAKKPQQPEYSGDGGAGGTRLDLQVAADIPQSLIVGRATTAGSSVYFATYGSNNSDLIEIVGIADHPCERLYAAFVAGIPATLRDSETSRGYLVDGYTGAIDPATLATLTADHGGPLFGQATSSTLYSYLDGQGQLQKYSDKLALKFFDGTQTEADAFAVAALAGNANQPWTADYIGVGNSYVRLHSIYDQSLVPGRLQWRFVVDGIRLYDPRLDSTVTGGSGSHRFDDLSTHEWTDNLAVICYNIVRGIYVADVNGDRQFFYGLENTSADQLPEDVWFSAMNECDVDIALSGGGTEKQFRAGGEITVDTEPLEAIKGLLKGCGGRFVEIGGVYKLYIGAPGASVLAIDDGVLIANRSDSFKPALSLTNRVNYLTAKYTSADDGWLPKVAPPREDAAWRIEDGRRLPADIDAPMVQSATQMQRVQQQLLNRSRRQRKHVIPLPPAAMILEPGDVFEWDSERNGYEGKLFEVDAADYESNLITVVSATEIDPTDYDWEAGDQLPEVDGRIITLIPSPKSIDDLVITNFIDYGDNSTSRPGIRLTWTDPEDGDADAVLWQMRLPDSISDVTSGTFDDVAAEQFAITAGLQPATTYEVRARFRSFNGFATAWSNWHSVTTDDTRIVYNDLTDAIQATLDTVPIAFDNAIEALRAVVDPTQENIFEKSAGDAAIRALLAGQENQSKFQNSLIQTRQDLSILIDTETTARVAAVNSILAQITDPSTGLSARAFASDVVTIQSTINDPVLGNSALASSVSSLRADVGTTSAGFIHDTNVTVSAVNNGSTGLATKASASDVTALQVKVGSYTQTATIGAVVTNLYASYSIVLDVSGNLGGFILNNDGSSTSAKLLGNLIVSGTITSTQLAALSVTAGKIAAGAITATEIAAGTITATQIATGTITATQMATGTITAASAILATASVDTLQIAGNAVTVASVQSGVYSSINGVVSHVVLTFTAPAGSSVTIYAAWSGYCTCLTNGPYLELQIGGSVATQGGGFGEAATAKAQGVAMTGSSVVTATGSSQSVTIEVIGYSGWNSITYPTLYATVAKR